MSDVTDWRAIEAVLREAVVPRRRPVAVAFRDAPPAGVARFTGQAPSGCSFWRLAAEGRTFFTVAADHANCAIGSYTHNIPLPAELEQTLGFMTGLGYVRMEDVPGLAVALMSEDAAVRWRAARALARMGPLAAEAVPGPEGRLVRRVADEALRRIEPD